MPTETLTDPNKLSIKEKLDGILIQASSLNNTDGVDPNVVIKLIDGNRLSANKFGLYSWIVQADQERCIAELHKGVKAGRTSMKGLLSGGQAIRTVFDMEIIAKNHKNEIDPVVFMRIDRFRGKMLEGVGMFSKAEYYYKRGMDNFRQLEGPNPKFIWLEFGAFAIHTLFQQNKTEEALELFSVVKDGFNNSEEGKWLQSLPEKDHPERHGYMYRIWLSGLFIRTAKDLVQKEPELAKECVRQSKLLLSWPDGSTDGFGIRLSELNEINI